jgi:hypothetical protein
MRGKPLKETTCERDGIAEILASRRAPGFIVKGEMRDKELPKSAKMPVQPGLADERDAEALERDYESVVAAKLKQARVAKERRRVGRKGNAPRLLGSIPFHEYVAVRDQLGPDAMRDGGATEIFKRRGRIIDD